MPKVRQGGPKRQLHHIEAMEILGKSYDPSKLGGPPLHNNYAGLLGVTGAPKEVWYVNVEKYDIINTLLL